MTDSKVVDPGDVQGLILRGYRLPFVCHFTLRIRSGEEKEARAFIRKILPRISSADEDPNPKPDFRLNIGLTYEGLEIMDPDRSMTIKDDEFSAMQAFVDGAIDRAENIGDVGENAPDHWRGGRERWEFHILLSVYGQTEAELNKQMCRLEDEFRFAFEEVSPGDRLIGQSFPDGTFHFGYQDGIAQPNIIGAPVSEGRDGKQPDSPTGAFLLGYPSQWKEYAYPPFNLPPSPKETPGAKTTRLTNENFWRNGSFVAFRMLKQDVEAFEAFLSKESARTGLNRELIAAKICGRWRNGLPLVLAPTFDSTIPDAQLNNFDYSLDPDGRRCPFGAHIRRSNPRDDGIASNAGSLHRIVRRGMPYGRPYDPRIQDSIERGLLGMFICVNLEDQFEFIMKNWLNKSGFNGNLEPNHQDPFVGLSNGGREFVVPGRVEETSLELSQFVTTRGAAYCFLPSITALRYLADLDRGEEYPPDSEKDSIERIVTEISSIGQASDGLIQSLKKEAIKEHEQFERLSPREPNMRLVHAKSHGSVLASFKVNSDLQEDCRVGIFQPEKSYDAVIRFSNASMVDFDDSARDLRGMAIKLFLDDGGPVKEQDFNLVSHKVFFSRDAKDFLEFAKAVKSIFEIAEGHAKAALTSNEFNTALGPYLANRPRQKQIFTEMMIEMTDPLTQPYYSQVPFKFGERRAVKYSVVPRCSATPIPHDTGVEAATNRIQHALTAHLQESDAIFDFCVQFQTDPAAMPIEDALTEWDEQLSPFVKLATLTIHRQEPVDVESWSFRPANALPEHWPLGGVNRARLAIYERAARARGAQIPTPEPNVQTLSQTAD
jgi:Dyp-type peroxidase family